MYLTGEYFGIINDQESKASSEASVANNPYYPYNQELFGDDINSTLDLGED